jgi:signal transduction histidine kinase
MIDTRILLVEDSKSIAHALTLDLEEQLGVRITLARSRAEADEVMAAEGSDFFLAILDLALPDAQGQAIVETARNHDVPAIVFTSTIDPELRAAILSKGVIDYIVKNERTIDALVSSVRRLWTNRQTRVLVVDDSSSARSHLSSQLACYMFEVLQAPDGRRALELLADPGGVAVVISDYEMPGMSGVELTRRIRSQYGPVSPAVIGVSSKAAQPLSVRFIKNGANDFLHKPFEREELYFRVVQNIEAIERYRRVEELSALKDQFLGMAAHDLRNPIGGIKGATELILAGLAGEIHPEQRELIEVAQRASAHMLGLVNDLLDISVIESGRLDLDLDEYEIRSIVLEQLHMARLPAQNKSITVQTDLAGPLFANCDAERFSQVVDNLFSNAVKYSPEGSTVRVSLMSTGGEVVLCVADEGPGIPEAEQDKLFQTFSKLSTRPTANEASTGLGLAIVRRIVDAHGGRVWVQSSPGDGSRFYAALPELA